MYIRRRKADGDSWEVNSAEPRESSVGEPMMMFVIKKPKPAPVRFQIMGPTRGIIRTVIVEETT